MGMAKAWVGFFLSLLTGVSVALTNNFDVNATQEAAGIIALAIMTLIGVYRVPNRNRADGNE